MNKTAKVYINALSVAIVAGLLFWFIDGYFEFIFFHQNLSFLVLEGPETLLESLFLRVPMHSLFVRLSFAFACLVSGLIVAVFLSRRKKAEALLIENEEKFKTLIRSIPDLIWLKDPNGVYLYCNSRFESFFGAKEREIVGKTDYDFVDKELADFFLKHDKEVIAKGKAIINEEEITFAEDGHHEILETIKTPIYGNDHRLVGVLSIGRNITERKNLQAQFIQAQKMESIGRLAGGVAHDYNNISSIILGYSELALEKVKQGDPLYSNIKEIITAAMRSTNITRQLMAFARQQTIAPRVLDLNKTVANMLKMLQRLIGEDINLTWMPGEKGFVKIDPSQIDQILANLCINARDAISDVGKISIQTEKISFDKTYCADHAGFIPGEYVMLAVSDDGRGMPAEILDKVFEPFFTTKDIGKGTGLGMATVYGIVKQNNGFINVQSEPEKGTAIKIYLPRHKKRSLEADREGVSENPLSRGETILLVEDNNSILKLVEKTLESLGYTVLSTTNPGKAMTLAKEHAGKIHLLITDVVMPEMNGRDLANQLQSHYPGLKTLFMSGYTADVIAHRGVLEKGVCFISKPFSKKEIAVKVREMMDKREKNRTAP